MVLPWLTLESKIKRLARMTGPNTWWSMEVFSWSFPFWVVVSEAALGITILLLRYCGFGMSEVLHSWSFLSGEASQFLVSYFGFIINKIHQYEHFIFRLLWRLDFWWSQCWKVLPQKHFHVRICMAHHNMDIASLAVLLYGLCHLW